MSNQIGESKLNRPLKPGEVLVFSEENYSGKEWLVTGDKSSLDLYFPIASLRVGPKTGVTIFSEYGFQGLAQDLSSELASFTESRLTDQKPKSLKIWAADRKKFAGFWAIEVVEGKYLSIQPDESGVGILTTSSKVSEWEAFRIADKGESGSGRKVVDFSVYSASFENSTENSTTLVQPPSLTIQDLQNVTVVEEPDAGFRKFSLLGNDHQWIVYMPGEEHFLKTADAKSRTIFHLSIKIAEDETQVGELVQGEAALYENPCYWGKAWIFYTDFVDFNRVLDLNDAVSSIQLGPLTGVTIFRDLQLSAGDKTGKQDITTNLPSLEKDIDNQISSIKIWEVVLPEKMGITITCCLSQDFRHLDQKEFEEYSAYRTNIRVPAAVETVEVWTTDETDIEVDEKRYLVDEVNSITLKPNLIQCLMITTDALNSSEGQKSQGMLRAPGLKIRTNTMQPHERIVIYPDQEVHKRLASLKEDELWNSTYTDDKGKQQNVIKDRSPQKRTDAANAQSMVKKIMSTVNYTEGASGSWEQSITPDGLGGKSWALDFLTYRVTADTLYVRKGPGVSFKPTGILRRNDVIEVLEFDPQGDWVHFSRASDGLTGWSSTKYLDRIAELPPYQKDEKYRVKALSLHVREGPGVDFHSLGYIKRDEIVTSIAETVTGDWIKIVRSDGLTGWSSARYLALVNPRPKLLSRSIEPAREPVSKPGIFALSPMASFHEISQAEVDALLAQARSPDTDLAQGISDDVFHIFQAVKTGVSFVVTKVEQAVALIVKIGKDIVDWIVDTADKVIAFVEGIFEKIGAAIQEIVKWLRFIFDWEDILQTRDYLHDSIISMLDFAGKKLVPKARAAVKSKLSDVRKNITKGFDNLIVSMGGKASGDAPSNNTASGIMSAIQSSELSKVLETGQWILSKVMSFAQGGILFALAGTGQPAKPADVAWNNELQVFWSEIMLHGLETVTAVPAGVIEIFSTLIQQPDKPLLAVAAFLNIFRSLALGLIDLSADIIDGLFVLAAELIEKIKIIFDENIRIPFISDLLAWMKVGDGSLGFSILDAVALILAVPVTVISKIILHEVPFKNEPVLGQSVTGWGITAGVSDLLNGIVSSFLDINPLEEISPGTNFVELSSLIFALTSFIGNYGPDLWEPRNSETERQDDPAYLSWKVLAGYEGICLLLDFVTFKLGASLTEKTLKLARFKRYNQGTMVAASVFGIIHIGLLVWHDIDTGEQESIVGDIWATLPEVSSFLKIFIEQYPICLLIVMWFAIVDMSAGAASLDSNLNSS